MGNVISDKFNLNEISRENSDIDGRSARTSLGEGVV